jgi:hypothetical protein
MFTDQSDYGMWLSVSGKKYLFSHANVYNYNAIFILWHQCKIYLQATWEVAWDACCSIGMKLVSFESNAEILALGAALKGSSIKT